MSDRAIIWSYGGGVQTIAILVLIVQDQLPRPERVIMADTGRERTATWRYYQQHARPLLNQVGLELEIASHRLSKVDLYGHNGDLLLPAFTQSGKLPTFCSDEWKKLVVRRYLRSKGYGPDRPVLQWLGMSLDEVHRLRESGKKWIKNHYPLCFDVKLRRYGCLLKIREFGLPDPPKSACWMCPNLINGEWAQMKEEDPQDFQRAVLMDRKIREADTQGGVFLHHSRVPLSEADLAVKEEDLPLLECANTCWT